MQVLRRMFGCGAIVGCVLSCWCATAQETVVAGKTRWLHLSSAQGDLPAPGVGRQVAALVADIDKDGKNDFLIASYEKMVWYRRNSEKGDGTKLPIENGMATGSLEAGGEFYDIDGDGDLDLVMGAAYGGKGCVWWWENPYPKYDPKAPWQRHLALQVGGQHHDQIFGDFDGDGKVELAFFSNRDGKLYLAKIPADPRTTWPVTEIASLPLEGGNPEGFAKADLNGDGKLDLIGGGWWFEHLGAVKFKPHTINPRRQFSRCAVGDLVKGGRPEIVLNSGDGVGPLEMYRWEGSQWAAKTLIERMDHGHTLQIGDIDGDGNLDILAAEMHTPGPRAKCRLFVLYGDGRGNFRTVLLSTGIGSHESKLGDLDGDGRLDILQKDFQQEQRIDLWLNRGAVR